MVINSGSSKLISCGGQSGGGGGGVFRQSVAFSPEGFRLIHRGAACRAVDGLWVKDDIISIGLRTLES